MRSPKKINTNLRDITGNLSGMKKRMMKKKRMMRRKMMTMTNLKISHSITELLLRITMIEMLILSITWKILL